MIIYGHHHHKQESLANVNLLFSNNMFLQSTRDIELLLSPTNPQCWISCTVAT